MEYFLAVETTEEVSVRAEFDLSMGDGNTDVGGVSTFKSVSEGNFWGVKFSRGGKKHLSVADDRRLVGVRLIKGCISHSTSSVCDDFGVPIFVVINIKPRQLRMNW